MKKRVSKVWAESRGSVLVSAGSSLVTLGLWLVHPAVALIIGGLTLVAIGMVVARDITAERRSSASEEA